MHLRFGTFNFKGQDLAAEERNYADNHVALAKSLPGVRIYVTGKLRETKRVKPDRYRAALMGFDDADASRTALASETGSKLFADRDAHLAEMRLAEAEGEMIVPFDSRSPGKECLVLAAKFNFKPQVGELARAEYHYTHYHVGLAKQLPGLLGYTIGKLLASGAEAPDRYRIAWLFFECYEAMRDAYRSQQGERLIKDEEFLIADPQVFFIDGRVEV